MSFQRLGQKIADLSRELSDITKLAGAAAPRKLELEYIQRMMAWLLWRPTDTLGQGHAVQVTARQGGQGSL